MEPVAAALGVGALAVAAIVGLVAGAWIGRRLARRRPPLPVSTSEAAPDAAVAASPGGSDGGGLIASLTIGVVQFDERLLVVYANPAAAVLLDLPVASLVGRSAMEVFLDRRIETVLDAARDGTPGLADLRLRETDGRQVVLRARRAPRAGVWVVLEDVTALRRLQQIRAEFIDNMSHELRTPLTTVSLLAETLARDADAAGDAVPARMRDRISKIEVETDHLVQMVNELLDLSRIESGPPMRMLDDVDLARLAAASVERIRQFADRQGVRLEVDLPGGLPSVRGNEERLGQVLVNLLHNAVKFSPEGGDVVVRIRARRSDVVLDVEDHGVGIPRIDQARVFERFYKVDRARVRGGGTGLGLSIARHVVEAHAGRISVQSEEGIGSTFSVVLPAAPSSGARSGERQAVGRV
jgi:two-component system phosphate regulon sensor histidine kinase PhoR